MLLVLHLLILHLLMLLLLKLLTRSLIELRKNRKISICSSIEGEMETYCPIRCDLLRRVEVLKGSDIRHHHVDLTSEIAPNTLISFRNCFKNSKLTYFVSSTCRSTACLN